MAPNSLPRASFPRLAVAIHHALRAEATAAAPALASNGSPAYPCRTAPRTRNERTAGMKDVKRAWQRMLSGRRLDLLAPSPVDIELEDIAHGSRSRLGIDQVMRHDRVDLDRAHTFADRTFHAHQADA